MRRAPIVAFVFSGCICLELLAISPRPTAAIEVAATAPVEPTEAPGAAAESSPMPPPSPTMDPAKKSACEGYVAVLSGRKQDPALLESAEIKTLAMQAPDLLTCGAVAADSDALCKKLLPVESGPTMMCRNTWAIFHELRQYPKGHSFMFSEIDWQSCRHVSVMPAGLCDGMRDALRSGDVQACAKAGDGESICRAYMTLDASLCRMEGKAGTAAFKSPGRKQGEPSVTLKKVMEESCRNEIENKAVLAKGLKGLAESGPAREQAFAKAALGEADACASFVPAALQYCTTGPPAEQRPEAKPGAADPANGGESKGPGSEDGGAKGGPK